MGVLFTLVARVRDWQELRCLHHDCLLPQARAVCASSFRVYRDANDASRLLVLAELPDHDAARELRDLLHARLAAPPIGAVAADPAWEPLGWAGIDPLPGVTEAGTPPWPGGGDAYR